MKFLTNADHHARVLLSQSPDSVFVLARNAKVILDKLTIKYHSYITKQFTVIFSMGRVGSTSVYESLTSHDLKGPLFKVHILTRRGLERL